ncbi:hypothetical protein [Bacteroides sp. AF32-8BH]|uniref:hypothetical protein n=1 Tax=Bacteroides sp. AF32-8BH TaxID=2302925 RepID=UPI000E3FB700|nr:hypothetical protein [Bacteroides sp. AF32-8BH]RGE77065.1 hypothetical protein DWZ47_18695 [Bacteroides sp. AF32-8BH]
MGAIGLNPIRLDRIGLDPIRINAIKLGVPGAASERPYIDPEVLASLKAVCICYGKSNDDPDRAIVKNLVDPDNPFVISNAAYTEGSGYADKDSPYYGAFVTDGVDDLITSTKTVQEMLGGSNEITVVSMIHKLSLDNNWTNLIGELKEDHTFVANRGINTDKTGIYGYTYNYKENAIVINNILGDKNDYIVRTSTSLGLDNKYYVTGFKSAGIIQNISQLAWYWTFIANRVLTTDEINQVIAYYNLDRTLKPDILCNTIKQGITNENHAEFGDKLIDFSGNGRDIQLNNLAWDGDSGIGKYNYPNWKVTATIANTYSTIVNYPTVNGTYSINVNGVSELMQSIGLHLEIKYTTSTGIIYNDIKQDGVYSYILPDGATDLTLRFGGIPGIVNEPCNITITQIPSHAGALRLDGVSDFGKVTGMPIYKDYTVVADREIEASDGGIVSKGNPGAFILELEANAGSCYSFGLNTTNLNIEKSRKISYLSKYLYNGVSIEAGTAEDSDSMWLGTIRDRDSRFFNGAIYSLMSFPYSMSEFLIERQLKKHKLGTLYPDMVEFRPIVKSNLPYSSISYSVNPGEYISVDSMVTITVTLPNTSDKLMEVSCNAISDISISGDNGVYEITGKIVKSPQKINLVISSYLTMLNNETLISNETLIKNE